MFESQVLEVLAHLLFAVLNDQQINERGVAREIKNARSKLDKIARSRPWRRPLPRRLKP